jgi:hypothetical protein
VIFMDMDKVRKKVKAQIKKARKALKKAEKRL